MKAILFKTDGTETVVEPKDGKKFSLAEMYELITCDTVEHVDLGKGVDMWCDEEGLMKANWQLNKKATAFYRAACPHVDPADLGIVGNALVVDNTKAQAFFK